MNLEEKLRQLKQAAQKSTRDRELERQLEYLRRREHVPKTLPSQRVPRGIDAYVEGQVSTNDWGDYFWARQALPFGRPYGKLRIGELSTADFKPLELFLENTALPATSELVYLDTETTGLAGGTGTYVFLIGLAHIDGGELVLRQHLLRDLGAETEIGRAHV